MRWKKTRPTLQEYKDTMRDAASAAIILWDYDGYYNPKTKKGNVVGLAEIIDEAFMILNNGKHWDGRTDKTRARKRHS